MEILIFLWLAKLCGGYKTPLPSSFIQKIRFEDLREYDPEVSCYKFCADEDGLRYIVRWSQLPCNLFRNIEKCPWMHPTYFDTIYQEMYDLICQAAVKLKTVDHLDTRFLEEQKKQEIWMRLKENMEEQS
jgi:hypothetical protein